MCKPTDDDNDNLSIKGTLVAEDNGDVETSSPSKQIVYLREAKSDESSALTSTLGIVKWTLALLGLICVGLIATTIALAANKTQSNGAQQTQIGGTSGADYIYPSSVASNVPENTLDIETVFATGENTCENKNPKFENVDCVQ